MEYYSVGKILTTHGLKGELKVAPDTDFDRFFEGNRLYINHKGEYIEVIIKSVRDLGNYLLITFKDLLDINLVEKYRGDLLYISETDREELDKDEDIIYYSDLMNKNIFNQNGEERGKVIDILEMPHAKYLVSNYNGKKSMIPFIDEFILEVNDDKIIIKEIEGLF